MDFILGYAISYIKVGKIRYSMKLRKVIFSGYETCKVGELSISGVLYRLLLYSISVGTLIVRMLSMSAICWEMVTSSFFLALASNWLSNFFCSNSLRLTML
eukprot:NODE_260_length_12610_cov_0.413076.p13 type:complete len:101 gc:universal NODE_260_length_12610_cov_0.413076:4319-4621(+)